MEFNSLVPELLVANLENSLKFYVDNLGFKTEFQREEDKFAYLSFGKSQIMINQDNGHWETGEMNYPRGRGVNFQIECDDVADIQRIAINNNFTIFRTQKEEWYRVGNIEEGVKEILIQDPDGYLLRFQQYLGQREQKN